ncbi:uncharacterized protein Dere_GG26661 [Drosophila erecta]|uniref:Uncharacterized protein n=1 Tax=Drosophila erecta TaxID=7220 RepID=A0A0Q5VYV9_DROER|nr:uncharacterized protein Dere_GG26661 [Drosophila erecta]
MKLFGGLIIWVCLAAPGPNWLSTCATGFQVQVRIPIWDVAGLIKRVTTSTTGHVSYQKKKERPVPEDFWPPLHGYYDPLAYPPPPFYPYPPYVPPNKPPIHPPTHRPTNPPTRPPTKAPTNPPTKPPTNPPTNPPTTTKPPEETTTEATTEETTESPTDTTSTTDTTTEPTTEPSICSTFPQLPICQVSKSVHLVNKSSNVLYPEKKLSIETVPHSVTSLCFYYPRLCTKPEEAQFVRLSDENGRPLLLISAVEENPSKNKRRNH